MTDPKIVVSADVTSVNNALASVQKQVEKLNQTASSGKIGIDVKEIKSEVELLSKLTQSLADSMDKVAKSGESVTGVNFGAVSAALKDAVKTTSDFEQVLEAVGQSSGFTKQVQDAERLVAEIQRVRKAQEALSKEGIKLSRQQAEEAKKQFDVWRKSGARGTSKIRDVEFDDWVSGKWRDHSIDERESRRHRNRILRTVGVETVEGTPDDQENQTLRKQRRAHALAGALGGAVGSFMQGGTGNLGGAIGQGLGGLMGTGAGALAGGAFGGPVGALVGGVVGNFASNALGGIGSALDAAVQRVIDQNSTLTDLRHSLGETTTDFDTLRTSVMTFTNNLGITGQESARLARVFADASGKVLDAVDVGRSTGNAVGFARGYGMDPAASVQFFGSMRHFGVTKDDQSDKRLALLIGEAVGRNGMNPKMGEFMGALQSYVEQQTRSSLTSANSTAYASFMSSMTGLNLAGLKGDPTTALTAMGQADASLKQGGAFGEASKLFTLGMYQRMRPGFNVFDMGFATDQGAFGTLGRAFGEDSPAMAMARAAHDKGAEARFRGFAKGAGSDESMLSLQMKSLEKFYGGGGVEVLNKAIQSHLGVNADQAAALYTAFKSEKGLGGLQSTLKEAGVEVKDVDPKRIAALAQVASMDAPNVRKEAQRLLDSGQLSKPEFDSLKGKIDSASTAGNDEDIKKMVLNLTALHDIKDNGDAAREQQANMVRSLDTLVEQAVPSLTSIKSGIIELVRKLAPESNMAKQEEARRHIPELNAKIADLQQRITNFRGFSHDEAAALNDRRKKLQSDLSESISRKDGRSDKIRAEIAGIDAEIAQRNPQAKVALQKELKDAMREREGYVSRSGEGNLRSDYDYFKSNGVSDQAARGIAAGIRAEGGTLGYSANGAFGIGQWRGERLKRLLAKYGPSPTLDQQREFMLWELRGGDRGGKKVLESKTADEALSNYVGQTNPDGKTGWGFMRPAAGEQRDGDMKRGRDALDVLDAVTSSPEYAKGPGQSRERRVVEKPKEPPVSAMGQRGGHRWRRKVALDDGLDGKVPAGSLRQQQLAMRDSHQVVEHRVTVLDGDGMPHYNAVTQTRIGQPMPAGMAMA